MLIKWVSFVNCHTDLNQNNSNYLEHYRNVSFKSITDNTLNDFNEIETNPLDENANIVKTASLGVKNIYKNPQKLNIHQDMKEWLKTLYKLYRLSTNLESDNQVEDNGLIVQCSPNFIPNSLPDNTTEVFVDPIDTNEISIILPKFPKDKTNEISTQQSEERKQCGDYKRTKISERKRESKTYIDHSPEPDTGITKSASQFRHFNSTSNYNLFTHNFHNRNKPVVGKVNQSSSVHSRCYCNHHQKSLCEYRQTCEALVHSRNWSNRVIQSSKANNVEKKPNQVKENYLRNLGNFNLSLINKDEWYRLNKKYNGSCGFQRQLCKIKQHYLNRNNIYSNDNNNNKTIRRNSKTITEIGNTFPNSESLNNASTSHIYSNNNLPPRKTKINNNLNCNYLDSKSWGKSQCANERNINHSACECRQMKYFNTLKNNDNCCSQVQQNDTCCDPCCEPCRQCLDPVCNPCCNMYSSNMCCNQMNRIAMCCEKQNLCNCCNVPTRNCCDCHPVSYMCCCESCCSCMSDPNIISKNSDDSSRTVYCESSASQPSCEQPECCCPCRCSQFPKPPPYCLNTTYRMNYFQKCIPKFRRYRECDNLCLPLC